MNPANILRARVIEKFKTVGNFAKAIGWSLRKCSYILTGRQALTVKEAELCAEVLDIDNIGDFMRIFYPMLSIKWTKRGA